MGPELASLEMFCVGPCRPFLTFAEHVRAIRDRGLLQKLREHVETFRDGRALFLDAMVVLVQPNVIRVPPGHQRGPRGGAPAGVGGGGGGGGGEAFRAEQDPPFWAAAGGCAVNAD